jgi:hypothetical protein
MLTPKICREHAWKCIQTAEAFPPSTQMLPVPECGR